MTEMPKIEALEKIGPADVYRLFEPKTIRELARLKYKDRSAHEKLRVGWRQNKVPDLEKIDRMVKRAIADGKAKAASSKAEKAKEQGGATIYYDQPLDTARMFVEARRPTLMHHNGEWLDFEGNRYVVLEERALTQDVSRFLDGGMAIVRRGIEPIKQTPQLLAAVVDMLKTETHRGRDTFSPPCWLEPQDGDPPAHEVLACGNCLLHLPTGDTMELTPRFFTRNALEFDYDPKAPLAERFFLFLNELWPDTPADIELLQEVFGLLLIPDTSKQVIILVIGPSRGGKATLIRMLRRLVGEGNCASQTLAQMGKTFGMQSMIGKQLLTITDAYQTARMDSGTAAENLLRISGEDPLTIARKHIEDWEGTLPTRILIAATVPPILPDMSGSLANRYIPLVIRESFVGREDPVLGDKLFKELPGILNWAIEGWRRLQERGHFELTDRGRELLAEIRTGANPVEAFLHECCIQESDARIQKDRLHNAYLFLDGDDRMLSKSEFGRRLIAASGNRIRTYRQRTGPGGRQEQWYEGVTLREEYEDMATTEDDGSNW